MRVRALSYFASLTLAVAGAIAAASPTPGHNHHRLHVVRRSEVFKTVDVLGPTVVAFVLDGKIVGQNEICRGIDEGILQWSDPNDGPSECSSSSTDNTPKPTATITPNEVAPSLQSASVQQEQGVNETPIQSFQVVESTAEQAANIPPKESTTTALPPSPATQSDPAPLVTSSAPQSPSGEVSDPQSGNIPQGQGLDMEFPDGEIDCSTFPSQYGPIEVEWANLGGWAGIQYITVEGGSVTHIVTAVPGGKGCIPGAMCSYACPPGYQKSQWPSTQGSTGQSIGGIQCNSNGKLSLTNPELSKTLCMKGTGAATVHNKLSFNAAICRTDYPGVLECINGLWLPLMSHFRHRK